jgi:uncharacterized short protein YbdD (DUF466 family)
MIMVQHILRACSNSSFGSAIVQCSKYDYIDYIGNLRRESNNFVVKAINQFVRERAQKRSGHICTQKSYNFIKTLLFLEGGWEILRCATTAAAAVRY